jgi:hypothetical protein
MEPQGAGISPLAVLGFGPLAEELYRALLRHSPVTYDVLAEVVSKPKAEVVDEVARFVATGLADVHGDTVVAAAPDRALARVIDDEGQRLRSVQEQLDALRRMVPALAAEHMIAREPRGEPVGLEVVPYAQVVEVMQSLTARTSGELLWIRPDQWRVPEGQAVDEWVRALLRSGRRSRVIYPARALEEAPETVRRRAELGEHVRVLAELPGRVAVLGGAAVLSHRLDVADGPVLIVRQPALVSALRLLFEELWGRALPVPGLDGEGDEALTSGDRRLLLEQLGRGAKDEQIARAMGLSLRTVRRRVADVLDELGASSRFQAGVEAVRRGWI